MSQPSVTAYFNTRKRQATDELRNKAKVFVLERERAHITNGIVNEANFDDVNAKLTTDEVVDSAPKVVYNNTNEAKSVNASEKVNSAVRNIQFDSTKISSPKTPKMITRARSSRVKKYSIQEGQTDIRETFMKMNDAATTEPKKVVFEKRGALSPRKPASANKIATTPKKIDKSIGNVGGQEEEKQESIVGCVTPKKASLMDRLARQDLSIGDIKNRINKSSRLAELKDRIDRIKRFDKKLEDFKNQDEPQPKIKKFEKIQLEVPISPQKSVRSPMKTPTKNIQLLSSASPQRRLLFAPKESTPSPVKSSPVKAPAYQRYQSISDSGSSALPLPYNYRFLAEVFRCVDTVSAMLFNRKELITFKKLKPAVQELLRRNFNIEHLAQIKTVYPNAYTFSQEKVRSFGSVTKEEKFELVLTPNVEEKNGRNTPDDNDVLKSASEMSMGPGVLLERRRKFYNVLLEKTKIEHEKFLLNLESPMVIPKEKITRWHPEFDVETCPAIENAELPQPPNVERASSAQDVLERAKSLFNCNTRMEKALQRLADAKMTSMSNNVTLTADKSSETTSQTINKVDIAVVDTPPDTPKTQNSFVNPALKGIPKALLERVRAKQAAKALEAMTRTPNEDKEAAIYSRLPDMSKIVRNIFVAEKKGVLTLEFVIEKLDNSYRTKLTSNELEDHIRLMCQLLPTWATIHHVRKMDYLKIAKDVDIAKVVKRFEILANDKIKG
ncbi:hypothetical protein PV327_002079 [Microctonus hyperodae]|uniref:CDT1 Geminin-binding domain-containing protein n=1 Tax=Microctonus hyperodae TaxID=165561 RepID=A0AA39FET2_MICHY|nr:hypothetical protein PV327_002079 [Microctonus hyperodae]